MIVNYDGEAFPGEITSNENDMEVSVMHKSGWKWPTPIDKICYERKDVIKKLVLPKWLDTVDNGFLIPIIGITCQE